MPSLGEKTSAVSALPEHPEAATSAKAATRIVLSSVLGLFTFSLLLVSDTSRMYPCSNLELPFSTIHEGIGGRRERLVNARRSPRQLSSPIAQVLMLPEVEIARKVVMEQTLKLPAEVVGVGRFRGGDAGCLLKPMLSHVHPGREVRPRHTHLTCDGG